jgi:hypothetical protein
MRPLTAHERLLTRWMIEHGTASDAEKAWLLHQLDLATVMRRCGCGCASVDFAISGTQAKSTGLRIVGDFLFGDGPDVCGVFVFCCAELLAGIEVYSFSDVYVCRELPSIDSLFAW